MEIDEDKVDDAVLALLRLTLRDGRRAWKGFDWDALGRLHRKGLIAGPVGRAKSVVLTDEGLARSEALLAELEGREVGLSAQDRGVALGLRGRGAHFRARAPGSATMASRSGASGSKAPPAQDRRCSWSSCAGSARVARKAA